MTEQQIFYAHWGSIIAALMLVLMSWRWPPIGRLFFVVLFLFASQVNARLAFTRPGEYLAFARFTYLDGYRDFILGFFAQHTTVIVAAIAVGQFCIGLLLLFGGGALRLGVIGAIVFLVAVAPLGTGAGFPATLIMAWAAALLFGGRNVPALHKDLTASWQDRVPLRPPTSGAAAR
jgi:hypothetical protein